MAEGEDDLNVLSFYHIFITVLKSGTTAGKETPENWKKSMNGHYVMFLKIRYRHTNNC